MGGVWFGIGYICINYDNQMTPHKFKDNWTNANEPLSPLSFEILNRFGLSKLTVDFLTIAGLPIYAEPNLSFVNETNDIYYGINLLTERYDFFDKKKDFEKYVVIGSCRDGDVIAINREKDDIIEQLDHEDFFSSTYFNSSIEILADFLILYRDFEASVLVGKDHEDNLQCFNFTNEQFDKLKNNMLLIDSKAITERGFWKEEFEIMLSLREEYYFKN
jgi:hypothetical protein